MLEVSPGSESFGPVQVGQASLAREVTITNSGKGSTTVHASVRGDDAADFKVALDTCADAPLPGNSRCKVQLNFRPKSAGEKYAKLTFDASNAQVPPPIALNGTGRPPGAVSFDPPTVAIGLYGLVGFSAPPTIGTQILKIVNTGDGPLTINSVQTRDSHFSVTADCNGKRLPPGGSILPAHRNVQHSRDRHVQWESTRVRRCARQPALGTAVRPPRFPLPPHTNPLITSPGSSRR